MKIIDLLNRIANGEELPEIIKVMGATYYLCRFDQSGCCYFSEKQGYGGVKLSFDTSVMNDEIEILEEEKKIPKKLKSLNNVGNVPNLVEFADKQQLNNHLLKDKLNELIDYLKSKGDE